MNEKIEKLVEKAKWHTNSKTGETYKTYFGYDERFAELILKDVINSIESTGFNHVQKHGLRTTILSNLGYKYPYSEFE